MTNKLFMSFFIGLLVLGAAGLATAAVVYLNQADVGFSVSETSEIQTMSLSISGIGVGTTAASNISINNQAEVPVGIILNWSEVANDDLVEYNTTADGTSIYTLEPGVNNVPFSITVFGGSPVSDAVNGTISVYRTSA